MRVQEMMDGLVLDAVCVLDEELGQQPVRLSVTGQEDGVLL